jgi:glyoxylase-like metal-dependent hydrolase (beta-lactamase superfamily II)
MTDMSGNSPVDPQPVDRRGMVYRFAAPNPGPKTLQGTNTYIVGDRQVFVIDPGPDDERHLEGITDWLRAKGRTVVGILLTHGHPDHALGAAPLAGSLGSPIWAADSDPYPLYSAPEHRRLSSDATFQLERDLLRAFPTPGHTPDSMSYFLEGSGVLFTGDTVLGQGSTIVAPPEGDMTTYMDSLGRLRALPATILAPGHGPLVSDAAEKLREYIEHRRERERQLVNALADGPSSVPALVARLYVDTPPELRRLAEGSVTAGLIKLEREQVVYRDGEFWFLQGSSSQ